MRQYLFKEQAAFENAQGLPKEQERNYLLMQRCLPMYSTEGDVRSEYGRDYTRILHCNSYRRLKHKTQVFFNAAGNDHICTRMEHVAHVESVGYTIAQTLGLNLELVKAIAMAHDLGHAPFGHHGESLLSELSERYLHQKFWHERNGLYAVDFLELLPDSNDVRRNLNLSYAVRDGIVSHCGELDQNGLVRREQLFDLQQFDAPGKYQAATWEGCVVKLSDKIAYLGRDIEDATTLGYFSPAQLRMLRQFSGVSDSRTTVNTTGIMHRLITDLCANSNPDKGLCFSAEINEQLCALKQFNYKYIYTNKRLMPYRKYARLVLNELFNHLVQRYNARNPQQMLKVAASAPVFEQEFADYLAKYCDTDLLEKSHPYRCLFANQKIYQHLQTKQIYIRAVLDYLAGMTDPFAVKSFEELLKC